MLPARVAVHRGHHIEESLDEIPCEPPKTTQYPAEDRTNAFVKQYMAEFGTVGMANSEI
jgi:hypothetical protein